MPSTTCPKCQGRMEQGFLLDNTYGSRAAARWYAGPIVTSFWTGVKIKNRATYAVTAWRCGRCGFLECYATD